MSEKQCRLLEFDSEESWLEARKRYFTATMMADLATGGSGARERVYRDRHGLSKPFRVIRIRSGGMSGRRCW